MNRPFKRKNDLNRLRRDFKNELLNIEFARASYNYDEIIASIKNMQIMAHAFQLADIQTITQDAYQLVQMPDHQTPIFDETRLDTLIHLLRTAISEI